MTAEPQALVSVSIEPGWPVADDEALTTALQNAASAALSAANAPGGGAYEVSMLCAGDDAIAALNARFRDKPGPTNVLSFPSATRDEPLDSAAWASLAADGARVFLGDVALAHQTIAKEAAAAGLAFDAHVAHLIVHGVLHLCGYDHISDDQAARMEAAEVAALARLGVVSPYGADGGVRAWNEDDGRTE